MADDRPPSSSDMIRQAREQLSKPPSRSTRPEVDEAMIEVEVEQELRPSSTPAPQPDRQRRVVGRRRPDPSPFPTETRRSGSERRATNRLAPLIVGVLVILGLAILLSVASTTVTP